MHDKFTHPKALREKLRETFADHLPENDSFNIGYYEKRNNSRRWIESSDDLEAMYAIYNGQDTVNLWCEARLEKSSDDNTGDLEKSSKKPRRLEEVDSVLNILREKHSENFSTPQLRIWARMHVNGYHDDLDIPPNVPAISGHYRTKAKRMIKVVKLRFKRNHQMEEYPPPVKLI